MTQPAKTLADLKANPKNPRTITDKKRKMLEQALEKFGDLGGIVVNRRTGQLVTGHQRTDVLGKHVKIVVEKTFDPPTKTGTVAEGYVLHEGERFNYRETDWPIQLEQLANIASNKGAGSWDQVLLAEVFEGLAGVDLDFDVSLFSESERSSLIQHPVDAVADQAQPQSKEIACPACGHEFFARSGTRRV